MGFELRTLVVISTNYIDSCKSNYHAITTTTVPVVEYKIDYTYTGADPGFQVRGGRTQKNSAERREARKFLGYFM